MEKWPKNKTAQNPNELSMGWQAPRPTEQEIQRFALLVENSSDFIGIASIQGKTLYVNWAGQRLVGLESDNEAAKTTLFDFILEEDRREVRERIIPDLLRDGTWRGEYRLRHFKTGEAIPVEVHSFLIKDSKTGQPISINTIIRDISKHEIGDSTSSETLRKSRVNIAAQPLDCNAAAILKALDLIEHNLGERLTIDRIAGSLNMSKYHFARVFRRLVGMSPISFVTSARMDSACELLRGSPHSISAVAFKVGFSSTSHFGEQFRKLTGMTPTEYRSAARKSVQEE